MMIEASAVQPEEIYWSVLKGHWGRPDITEEVIRTNPAIISNPNLRDTTHCATLEKKATETDCPAVKFVRANRPKLYRATLRACEFVTAVSINAPHPALGVLAQNKLQQMTMDESRSSWSYFSTLVSSGLPDCSCQSILECEPGSNDIRDFHRTFVVPTKTGLLVFEGINRATAIAAAVLAGKLSPDVQLRAYTAAVVVEFPHVTAEDGVVSKLLWPTISLSW